MGAEVARGRRKWGQRWLGGEEKVSKKGEAAAVVRGRRKRGGSMTKPLCQDSWQAFKHNLKGYKSRD